MKILLACEESQAVTLQFRLLGHDAWSCDLQPTSGNFPEWHLQVDVLTILDRGWDILIAFPPCTHLASSGAKHFAGKIEDGRQEKAVEFFMRMVNAPVPRIAIENPVGIMSTRYRKPDQIIQPYYFGNPYRKTTCLWLKNLPLLFHAKERDLFADSITHVSHGEVNSFGQPAWYANLGTKGRATLRSKTFPGIATEMAKQWGNL